MVRDNSGAVLPGATVEARNVAQGAVTTQVSGADGAFRFPALIPGQYEVTVNLQGFATQKQTADVVLGSIKNVSFELGVGGVTENVQVTSEAPVVDVKQSQKSTNISQEQIDRLPKGRDFTSLITAAPGANQEPRSGGISIDGASASENRYIIDGAESTNLRSGTSGKILVTDFVEEVQIKSSGYTPEFGGSTGGVINVTSRTGTNAFRGSLLTYYENANLDGDVRPALRLNPSNTTQSEYITYDRDDVKTLYPGVTVGGPVLRDRMWFFAGYNPTLQESSRTVTFLSTGERNTFDRDFRRQNATGNVTAQPLGNLRLKGAINYSPGRSDGVLPAIDGSGNPLANYDLGQKTPNATYSGSADYVISNNFLIGARGGYYTSDIQDLGVFQGTRFLFLNTNIGLAGVPESLQRSNAFSNVPSNFESTFDVSRRTNAQVDATYFFNAAGSHSVKAGVQVDRIGNEVLNGETGNLVRLSWNRALSGLRGPFGYYQVRSNGVNPRRGFLTQGDISQTNVGFFVQDAWTVANRVTLNFGVRTENERVPSYSADPAIPPVGIEFGYGEKLAPRVGAAWDITGDGRNKLYGSWGVFYDIMKLELPRGSFGGDKWLEYYYTLDTADWTTLNNNPACPPACPGTLIRGPIDFRHPSNDPAENSVDPDLKPFKQQEAVIGFERELGSQMAASVRYVHKQVDRAIEDVGALDATQNEIYTISNPGFGRSATFFPAGSSTALPFPQAVREYDALEFVFTKRYANRWNLFANYTLSRLYGNYSGLSQSD
ncbi:MAG: TonB-dependent receptor, partial [Acidobacteria bacterium]|nr:TonB-dependent receptor [Acidobacteriota bacterium]